MELDPVGGDSFEQVDRFVGVLISLFGEGDHKLGVTRLGKEWILPVTINKATKQAAIIADLEPQAAQKLCDAYQAKKKFCEVRKAQQMSAPFSGFWR